MMTTYVISMSDRSALLSPRVEGTMKPPEILNPCLGRTREGLVCAVMGTGASLQGIPWVYQA